MNASTLWVSFCTILFKEIRRFMRIWAQTLLPPVITMMLYFVVFGSLIGPRIGSMSDTSYITFIVPGLIMMSVITNSYNNVVSSFFGNKFQRSIQELQVSPTPSWVILAGFISGSVVRGLIVGVLVTVLSLAFTDLPIHSIGVLLMVVCITAVVFSLAGFLNGLFAQTFDHISIVPTFVLTPLTYLGGVFYSITLLPEPWQSLSKLNPILYMVNAFRYGFLGSSDVPLTTAFGVLLVFLVALLVLCYRLLVTGRGLRG